jgi:glycosyltransferase involved in cell wall biosynthesis
VLADFPVALVHLHHLLQLPLSIGQVFKRRDVPYVFTAHDYFAICPNFVLLDYANNRPCDCSPESRARCLQGISEEHGTPGLNARYVQEHPRRLATFLSQAAAITTPSAAAKTVLTKHNPAFARAVVIEHGYDPPSLTRRAVADGPLRVGVVGHAFRIAKGRKHYERLIPALDGQAIAWHFLGLTERSGFIEGLEAAAPRSTFVWHGPYARGTLPQRLMDAQIDVCLSLQPWHETFSFTLSEAACAGVPSIVLPYGAPAQRVARDGLGMVAADLDEVRALLARFSQDRGALDELRHSIARFVHRTIAESCEAHRALYAAYDSPGP